MSRCWEQRGCDEEMQANCAHETEFHDRCPTKCAFANFCHQPQHELTTDPELLFCGVIDRDQAIKETCLFCKYFLTQGPRIDAGKNEG